MERESPCARRPRVRLHSAGLRWARPRCGAGGRRSETGGPSWEVFLFDATSAPELGSGSLGRARASSEHMLEVGWYRSAGALAADASVQLHGHCHDNQRDGSIKMAPQELRGSKRSSLLGTDTTSGPTHPMQVSIVTPRMSRLVYITLFPTGGSERPSRLNQPPPKHSLVLPKSQRCAPMPRRGGRHDLHETFARIITTSAS